MKTIFFLLMTLIFSFGFSNAQWNVSGNDIYNSNAGNVGIGTSTPSVSLEIRKDQDLETVVNVKNYFTGLNAKSRFQLTTATPLSYALSELQDYSGSPFYLFSTGSSVRGSFYQSPEFYWQDLSANTVFKVSAVNGYVTVGNVPSTPGTYKLFVESGILTEKVKVALKNSINWADHVFAPSYKLRPLPELSAFIKTNKHLPGIPSADELVKDGGLDVTEMFAKQMEKIEELTLYIIEQQKQIDELKATVSRLSKNKK